jgi:hypothetical protein
MRKRDQQPDPEKVQATFERLIEYIGPTAFSLLREEVQAEEAKTPGYNRGLSLPFEPGDLGKGTPGLRLDVRSDSIDFSVGRDGPYSLSMDDALALLPPDELPLGQNE